MRFRRKLSILLFLLLMPAGMHARCETLELPAGLQVIHAGAFAGSSSIGSVILPDGVAEIHDCAFADSSIAAINLPGSLTYISDSVFDGCEAPDIEAAEGTYAYEWAVRNGYIEEGGDVTYRALLIGNTYPNSSAALPGPDNDVRAMQSMLRLQTGTPYAVTAKLNQSASQIGLSISSALGSADENDVSIFYYSGHGSKNGSLVGTGSTYVSANQLRQHLDTVAGTKIVLLDCCYSGTMIGKSASEGGFNEAIIAAFSATPRSALAAGNYIVMTACSKSELSYSYIMDSSGGEFSYGLFTYALAYGSGYDMIYGQNCAAWADTRGNSDGKITLEEAYASILATVNDGYDSVQSPQYYGDSAFVLWSK